MEGLACRHLSTSVVVRILGVEVALDECFDSLGVVVNWSTIFDEGTQPL